MDNKAPRPLGKSFWRRRGGIGVHGNAFQRGRVIERVSPEKGRKRARLRRRDLEVGSSPLFGRRLRYDRVRPSLSDDLEVIVVLVLVVGRAAVREELRQSLRLERRRRRVSRCPPPLLRWVSLVRILGCRVFEIVELRQRLLLEGSGRRFAAVGLDGYPSRWEPRLLRGPRRPVRARSRCGRRRLSAGASFDGHFHRFLPQVPSSG